MALDLDNPRIIPRSEHPISRTQICDNAIKVLYRLKKAGFQSFLVGGAVRDLLLGREPKDFDIATDATPEEVHALFKNSRLIGRRFRLVHVRFGRQILEVATFRGKHDAESEGGEGVVRDGMIVRDNVYGTLAEDAWRRDFTVNALYYNIADFSVVDYTGGVEDLEKGQLCLIGDPEVRYREDPVRMLRAIRFAGKLGLIIEPSSEKAIAEMAELLQAVPSARLFDEVLKLFMSGFAVSTYELLRHYGLFGQLFPAVEESLAEQSENFPKAFLLKALGNTDARIAEKKPVTPAFLFASLLWEPVRQRFTEVRTEAGSDLVAMQIAGQSVIDQQIARVSLPKRFSIQAREIWEMQIRLQRRGGKQAFRLFAHPRFRAAYDFMLLRSETGEIDSELVDWWTEFQERDEQGRATMAKAIQGGAGRRRKK